MEKPTKAIGLIEEKIDDLVQVKTTLAVMLDVNSMQKKKNMLAGKYLNTSIMQLNSIILTMNALIDSLKEEKKED